jgi:hypothetical protein
MFDIFCGCIFFADDILLLSGSLRQLQMMLDICVNFANDNDIKFNHSKSHLFQVGLSAEVILPRLCLGCNDLEWVSELKYLGVLLLSGKRLCVNTDLNCRKFLGSSFALMQKCGGLSEEILCKLIMTHCVPFLFYGIDSVFLTIEQIHKMSVTFNTVFRRIFHMSRSTSMRLIYNFLGIKTFDCLYDERHLCLIRNCCFSSCELLRLCCSCCYERCWNTCFKYDVHFNLSVGFIKKQVWKYFKTTLPVN